MKYVPNSISRAVGRTVLRTRKNSPTLLFAAGVVGFAGTVVLACKATMEVDSILTSHEKQKLEIDRVVHSTSTEIDAAHRKLVLGTTIQLGRAYGPTVVCGVVSVLCLTKSHRILTERNTQLTAAYVGLQQFLESYRGRVREKIGEEEERGVYYASTPVELVQDGENGPEKIYGSSPIGGSPYSCVIDETKRGIFQESLDFNINFVRIQQNNMTNKLRAQGYLFLNDCYDCFDVSHTAIGQICGWFIEDNDSVDYVDITITPLHDGRGSFMLDFNVVGNVFQMLGDGDSKDHDVREKLPLRSGAKTQLPRRRT
jgi:hypothetical protein